MPVNIGLADRMFLWPCIPDTIIHCRPAASSVHYTTSCKHSLVLLMMGEIIARNMLS